MSRKPPTELDRLMLFVELAEHYMAACDSVPLETTTKVSMDEQVPLALELRLMLLRKFVEMERGDTYGNVHLHRVVQAFGQCFTGSSPALEQNLSSYADEVGRVLHGKTTFVVNGQNDDKNDVLYDALYGRLIHADWGRSQAHARRPAFLVTMALVDLWHHLDHLVREAHHSVRSAMSAGELRNPL